MRSQYDCGYLGPTRDRTSARAESKNNLEGVPQPALGLDSSIPRAQAIIGNPVFSGASGSGAASFAIGRQSVCSGSAGRLDDVPQDYYGRQRPVADDFGAISELATAPANIQE